LELWRGSIAKDLKKQSTIKISFKNFFQFTHEVKVLGNTKHLELWEGSRVGHLKRLTTVQFSFKKFFHFMCEVRVLGTNPRHNASGALNRIKSKRPEKTKHNQALLQ